MIGQVFLLRFDLKFELNHTPTDLEQEVYSFNYNNHEILPLLILKIELDCVYDWNRKTRFLVTSCRNHTEWFRVIYKRTTTTEKADVVSSVDSLQKYLNHWSVKSVAYSYARAMSHQINVINNEFFQLKSQIFVLVKFNHIGYDFNFRKIVINIVHNQDSVSGYGPAFIVPFVRNHLIRNFKEQFEKRFSIIPSIHLHEMEKLPVSKHLDLFLRCV